MLGIDAFAGQVRAARERIEALDRAAAGVGAAEHGPLERALEELRTTLEELQVAEEELRQQHEQVVATNAALVEQYAHYADLFSFAPDGYLVTDLDGNTREANRAAAEMLGARVDFLIPKPLSIYVPVDERRSFRDLLASLPRRRDGFTFDLPMRTRAGAEFTASVTVRAIRDADGAPTALRWALRDVTAQRVAERRVRELNVELEQKVEERTAQLHAALDAKEQWLERETAARAEAELARARLAFLSEAGALLSSSLDYATTLACIARLAVTSLADWCMVDTVDDDGTLRRMALLHRDPDLAPVAEELQRLYPPDVTRPLGAARAFVERRPILIGDLTDTRLREMAPDAHHEALVRTLGATSLICVPIVARDDVLGVISLVSSRPEMRFGRADLELAEEVARRVALALENARLYERARREIDERTVAQERLAEHKAEVDRLNGQLQRAMTETHHRVKNNLQLIAAMVDMQLMENHDTVPAAELARLNRHIRTLAAVHDVLTQQSRAPGELTLVSGRAILEELLTLVADALGPRSVNYQVHDVGLTIRQGTSLALVANELIQNAVKHSPGSIEVTLDQQDGAAVLSVCDDGPGFPPEFDPARHGGTGLELVESLGRWDLGGSVTYENRAPEGGARVTVSVPLQA